MSVDERAERWTPLDVEDEDVIEFDYSAYAATAFDGVPTLQVSVVRGVDASAGQLLQGSTLVDGLIVRRRISGAGRVAEAIYKVRCRATFADGRSRVLAALLPVVEK